LFNAFPEILSYIILGKIWLDYFKFIEITFKDLIASKTKKTKRAQDKSRLNIVYRLPRETVHFSLVIILSFVVYRWFTSSPLIIAISAWVFKQINYDISNIIVLAAVYIFKKPVILLKDNFTRTCKTTPNYIPSAIYVPQKSSSGEDAEWGINQIIRSYRNNLPLNRIQHNNYLIYHSDTLDRKTKYQEINGILNAQTRYGPKLFMFSRDTNVYAKSFLWKPGAYMSDYQILTTGIKHPLTYISKCFDTRRQLKVKLDNNKDRIIYENDHVPFCCDLDENKKLRKDSNYEYIIKYFPDAYNEEKNLFLKESFNLIKLGPEYNFKNRKIKTTKNKDLIDADTGEILALKETYKKDKLGRYCEIKDIEKKVKLINLHFLVDVNNPARKLKIHMGSIFNDDDILIGREDQWGIDEHGDMIYCLDKKTRNFNKHILPRTAVHVFIQRIHLADKTLIIDKDGNLVDNSTGLLWSKFGRYMLELEFDLYQKYNGKLKFIKDDYIPDKHRIQGEDFRRLPTDNFNGIPREIFQKLVDEKQLAQEEADNMSLTGIIGNSYLLNKGKNGWEMEFYVRDKDFEHKTKVIGGYIVKESDGYFIDEKGLLYKKSGDKSYKIESEEKVYRLDKHKENEEFLLIHKINEDNFEFIRDPDYRKTISVIENEEYILVKDKTINLLKPAEQGYVVNQRDGFYLDSSGDLWHIELNESKTQKTLLAGKDNVEILSKQKIFTDYSNKSKLVKHDYLAEAGSWYTDFKENYRRRKHFGNLAFASFNENLGVIYFDPISGEHQLFNYGSYCLSRNHIWSKAKFNDDEIIGKEKIIQYHNNLVKQEELANLTEYVILEDGLVELKNNTYHYGLFLLCQEQYLKDHQGNPVPADVKISIANQTDADTEFMPNTTSNLNSILIRNLQENPDPYLMLQPEISFGNAGASIFTITTSWAQEMYKFIDRTLFKVFLRSTAYGKMTKLLDAYINNITFKEAIPPIARTHDHWEAMKLKTALIKSTPDKKENTLLENVPENFLLYLKRQMGWLSGDLILLELETKFGKLLDLIRAIKWLVKKQPEEASYWFNHAIKGKHMIGYTSSPSSKERLESVKRTSFDPLFFGIWILIIGSVASIFPGTLSINTSRMAWSLFWIIIAGLIVLPKFILPTVDITKKYLSHIIKFASFLMCTVSAILVVKLAILHFDDVYKNSTYYILIWFLTFILIIKPLLLIIFAKYTRMKYRIMGILGLASIPILSIYYLPTLIYKLDYIPSARWIPFFSYVILPNITSYLLPFILSLTLTEMGRKVLNAIKRGSLEAIYSTSLLLMMVIYTTMGLYNKIRHMIHNPHTSFSWTPAEIYKYIIKQPTIFDIYKLLIAAPLASIMIVILPVAIGLADYSLIFYGWPIFIWSWLLGPLLAYLTSRYGRNLHYNELYYLVMKENLINWINDYKLEKKQLPDDEEIIQTILSLIPEWDNFTFSKRIKLYIYYLSEKITDTKESINYEYVNLLIENNFNKSHYPVERIREYNWQTYSEIDRAKFILKKTKLRKSQEGEIVMLKIALSLLMEIGSPKPGASLWNDLRINTKRNIVQSMLIKHKLTKKEKIIESKYYKNLEKLLLK